MSHFRKFNWKFLLVLKNISQTKIHTKSKTFALGALWSVCLRSQSGLEVLQQTQWTAGFGSLPASYFGIAEQWEFAVRRLFFIASHWQSMSIITIHLFSAYTLHCIHYCCCQSNKVKRKKGKPYITYCWYYKKKECITTSQIMVTEMLQVRTSNTA